MAAFGTSWKVSCISPVMYLWDLKRFGGCMTVQIIRAWLCYFCTSAREGIVED